MGASHEAAETFSQVAAARRKGTKIFRMTTGIRRQPQTGTAAPGGQKAGVSSPDRPSGVQAAWPPSREVKHVLPAAGKKTWFCFSAR